VAQSCPHCGVTLPAVVDAFCPECRTDLSQTPQEVTDTARRTAAALTGRSYDDDPGARAEEDERAASAARDYIGRFALGGAALFVGGLLDRNWWMAAFGLAGAILFGLMWHRFARTTVSGKSKTTRGSDTPQ
jgi:hypothetical protein